MRGHETGFPRLRGGENWFEEGAERGISLFCYEHQETHGGMGSVLGTVLFDLLFHGGAGWRGSSRAPRSPRQPVWILELPMSRTSHFFSFWTATFGHPAARLPSSISSLISTHYRPGRLAWAANHKIMANPRVISMCPIIWIRVASPTRPR